MRGPFFMPGHLFDQLTETITDIDESEGLEHMGYRALSETSDVEWLGAQDPAWLEQQRLSKRHGEQPYNFIHQKLRR